MSVTLDVELPTQPITMMEASELFGWDLVPRQVAELSRELQREHGLESIGRQHEVVKTFFAKDILEAYTRKQAGQAPIAPSSERASPVLSSNPKHSARSEKAKHRPRPKAETVHSIEGGSPLEE